MVRNGALLDLPEAPGAPCRGAT